MLMSSNDTAADDDGLPAFDRLEPQALKPDRPTQAGYPVASMGPLLANAVNAISKKAYVPQSLAAQSILAACSLAVQPHFDVRLPTGQRRPTSLFLVSVAESGDRKSTADDLAMRAVREYEDDLETAFAEQKFTALNQQMAWDEAKRDVTNRNKKAGREALAQAYADLGPRPDGPVEPTIVVRTGTTEGLLKKFRTARPSIGLMSDEGGSWLGGYGMNEDNRLKTIATLSDFWDGKTVQTLTSGEGYVALRNRRLTFHLMVQPIIADKLLGDAEAQGQGFLSRLLVSHPDSLAGTRFLKEGEAPDPDIENNLELFQRRLRLTIRAALPVDPDTGELSIRTLDLDENASRGWREFYNEIEGKLGPDGEYQSVKGFVGKLPEMAARISAVIALFNQGSEIDRLTGIDMSRGIDLAKFYLSEALRLFGQARPSRHYEDAQTLSDWLSTKWDEPLINLTHISRSGPAALRNRSDYLRELIATLVRHDHLVELRDNAKIKGKTARNVYRVVVGRG